MPASELVHHLVCMWLELFILPTAIQFIW